MIVQNSAARILTGAGKRQHITPVLRDLHWLPVDYRIRFKLLLLTHKALYGTAPPVPEKLALGLHLQP